MGKFMATRKGKTAGAFDTAQAAREDWFLKYPREKFCTVVEGYDGPNNTFIRPFGARMWADIGRNDPPLGE